MRSAARHHLISGSAGCGRDPNRAFWRLQAQDCRDPSVLRWSTQAGLRSHDGLGGGGGLAGGSADPPLRFEGDRKSTRLNSSHTEIYTLSLHDALPIFCIAVVDPGRVAITRRPWRWRRIGWWFGRSAVTL